MTVQKETINKLKTTVLKVTEIHIVMQKKQ